MFDLQNRVIKVHEPFAAHLGNPLDIVDFEIGLKDVARLSGHLCPSVVGAFLLTQKAIEVLYPEKKVCIRGSLEVHLPGPADAGALGPMANVMSYITGAWAETGFGGLRGEYSRRNLLHFSSPLCKNQEFIFVQRETHATAVLFFNPSPALQRIKTESENRSFQEAWQANVGAILNAQDAVLIAR